jgi:predicted restriction endonuclease
MSLSEPLLLAKYKRNDDWPKVRRLHLKLNPQCAVCGATKRLAAHHIKPYQWHSELEMEPSNLITLCPLHHLFIGHLMRWSSYNENVVEDAKYWNKRIKERPKWHNR